MESGGKILQGVQTLERANILMTATEATPRPIPPYICLHCDDGILAPRSGNFPKPAHHSGKLKKRYCPFIRRKIPPAIL